jgi:hypothetical protein
MHRTAGSQPGRAIGDRGFASALRGQYLDTLVNSRTGKKHARLVKGATVVAERSGFWNLRAMNSSLPVDQYERLGYRRHSCCSPGGR